jgi:cytochrome bd-type quinol oxidase subunit 2
MPGSSSSFIKKAGSFVPGSALVLFGKWINLFSGIYMTNPLWERRASTAALAFGAVLSLGSIYLYSDDDKPELRIYAVRSLKVFLSTALLCYASFFFVSSVRGFDTIGNIIWFVAFVVSMVSLCLFLTFLAMREEKTSKIIFAICIIVLLTLVVALVFSPDVLHNLYDYLRQS